MDKEEKYLQDGYVLKNDLLLKNCEELKNEFDIQIARVDHKIEHHSLSLLGYRISQELIYNLAVVFFAASAGVI